jgi:hypothetical protein
LFFVCSAFNNGFAEVELYNEATEAMAPAIKEGDILVINTGSSSFRSIVVDDVIVFGRDKIKCGESDRYSNLSYRRRTGRKDFHN